MKVTLSETTGLFLEACQRAPVLPSGFRRFPATIRHLRHFDQFPIEIVFSRYFAHAHRKDTNYPEMPTIFFAHVLKLVGTTEYINSL